MSSFCKQILYASKAEWNMQLSVLTSGIALARRGWFGEHVIETDSNGRTNGYVIDAIDETPFGQPLSTDYTLQVMVRSLELPIGPVSRSDQCASSLTKNCPFRMPL